MDLDKLTEGFDIKSFIGAAENDLFTLVLILGIFSVAFVLVLIKAATSTMKKADQERLEIKDDHF